MLIGYVIATALRSVILFAAFFILSKFGMAGTTIGIVPIMSAAAIASVIDVAAGAIADALGLSMSGMRMPMTVKPGSTMPKPADTASNNTDVPGGALTTVGAMP
jgi:hypothetical protein